MVSSSAASNLAVVATMTTSLAPPRGAGDADSCFLSQPLALTYLH